MEVRDTLRFWALDRKVIKEFFQKELATLSGEVGADAIEMFDDDEVHLRRV
jgi:hypothetical protein